MIFPALLLTAAFGATAQAQTGRPLSATPEATPAAERTAVAPEITEDRNASAGMVIMLGKFADKLTETCSAVDAPTRTLTETAMAGWNERNGNLVEAANRYFRFARADMLRRNGEDAANAFYEAQMPGFDEQASQELDRRLDGQASADGCKEVLDDAIAEHLDVRVMMPEVHDTVRAAMDEMYAPH
jgi:hypothetical protein